MGGRVDVAGGAASQRWLSLVPLPPSILPQSLSLDLTFLATVVLVLTVLSLFFNLSTRKPNWVDFSQLMFSLARCATSWFMQFHILRCCTVFCFLLCGSSATRRGALAQPIQLWLLVAEEKLFRRHTSSFKGDIKDVPKIRKTIKIIFSNYSADTPWLYGGFPLFTCSLKHLSIAYWPISLLGGKCLEIYFNNCLMQNTWKTNSSELSCLRMFLSRKEVITELYRLSHETWSRPWNWEGLDYVFLL